MSTTKSTFHPKTKLDLTVSHSADPDHYDPCSFSEAASSVTHSLHQDSIHMYEPTLLHQSSYPLHPLRPQPIAPLTPTPSPAAPPMPVDPLHLNANGNKGLRYGNRSNVAGSSADTSSVCDVVNVPQIANQAAAKAVSIGQTTLHPYRAQSYSMETEYANQQNMNALNMNALSFSRSTDCTQTGYAPPSATPQLASATTTGTTWIRPSNESTRERLKNIRINKATTSTPIKSPTPSKLCGNTVTWQTYIGHTVFHEHERGHSLYQKGTFERIGQGVFARVYKTKRKEPQRTVALKVLIVK